jgi:N-acetylglucosamine-6-sulfatase
LGQLNLNWDTRNVYEQDVRIHLLLRGPGIAPGSTFDFPATNVDLAPTILGMAGLEAPEGIDGKSFLPLLVDASQQLPASVQRHLSANGRDTVARDWRDHLFIEYYYVGLGSYCAAGPIELPDNNFIAVRHLGGSAMAPDGQTARSTLGNLLYAEFQNGTDGNVDFAETHHFELFDLDADPWQLNNIYEAANESLKDLLHQQVRRWLHCKGGGCW